MKRFLLFAYFENYPAGGAEDFQNSFTTLNEAYISGMELAAEYINIIDIVDGHIYYSKESIKKALEKYENSAH